MSQGIVTQSAPFGAGTLSVWDPEVEGLLCTFACWLLAAGSHYCCWADFPTWLLGRSGCRCHSSEAGFHQHFLPRSLKAGEPLSQPGMGCFLSLLHFTGRVASARRGAPHQVLGASRVVLSPTGVLPRPRLLSCSAPALLGLSSRHGGPSHCALRALSSSQWVSPGPLPPQDFCLNTVASSPSGPILTQAFLTTPTAALFLDPSFRALSTE